MKTRLGAGFVVVLVIAAALIAVTVSGCGHGSGSPGPTVSVDWIKGSGDDGYIATLSPSNSPACTVAFKVVRKGQVKTLASYRVQPLQAAGSVSVQSSSRTIDAFWILPGNGGGVPKVHVDIPRRILASGAAWGGASVGGPYPLDGEEQTIWAEERYDGKVPDSGGLLIGSFKGLVDDSSHRPSLVAYCITVAVKTD